MNLRDHRTDPDQSAWELPPWGHQASMMVMPLFMTIDEHLFPIGSAFTVGSGLGFVMTAMHNIMEAIKEDGFHDTAVSSGKLPEAMSLRHIGLSVLHQAPNGQGGLTLNFLPLTSVEGAPPTDVVIGFAQLPLGTRSISLPLSFAVPAKGDLIWSLGYHDFKFPEDGIPIAAVRDGSFDWQHDYSHRFLVVEAEVEAAFSARLAAGFLEGPCFVFDQTIPHGLSGGPVISADGHILGINSAGAETFFGKPMSAASMLYPLALTSINFGATIGPLTLKSKRPMIDLIGQGIIRTDGTEERLAFTVDDGMTSIIAGVPTGSVTVFEDLSGYQSGTAARRIEGEYFIFKRVSTDAEGDHVSHIE